MYNEQIKLGMHSVSDIRQIIKTLRSFRESRNLKIFLILFVKETLNLRVVFPKPVMATKESKQYQFYYQETTLRGRDTYCMCSAVLQGRQLFINAPNGSKFFSF